MPKHEAPLSSLESFLPEGSASLVFEYLKQYKVHLTITRGRRSILGDYRHAAGNRTHRISINGNLNRYAFLITLIHELAHLVTFIRYQHRVAAHGREWKDIYKMLLLRFLINGMFPPDIQHALERSLHNLPASSCADESLTRVLKLYDDTDNGLVMVDQLPTGALFNIEGGRRFRKDKQLRKRFQCTELSTGKIYLFSPVYEVKPV